MAHAYAHITMKQLHSPLILYFSQQHLSSFEIPYILFICSFHSPSSTIIMSPRPGISKITSGVLIKLLLKKSLMCSVCQYLECKYSHTPTMSYLKPSTDCLIIGSCQYNLVPVPHCIYVALSELFNLLSLSFSICEISMWDNNSPIIN